MFEETPIFEELASRYGYQRAPLRRSLMDAIADNFGKAMTDERMAELMAEWSV
jgi:hypothetical protein